MKKSIKTVESTRLKFPLAAVIFFCLYAVCETFRNLGGMGKAIWGFLKEFIFAISCIGDGTLSSYCQFVLPELSSRAYSLVFSACGLLLAAGLILVTVALCRKKCGKMMAFGGATVAFSALLGALSFFAFVFVNYALKTFPSTFLLGSIVSWIVYPIQIVSIHLYSDYEGSGTIISGCLPLIILGIFLMACASKRFRDGMRAAWYLPFIAVVVLLVADHLNELLILAGEVARLSFTRELSNLLDWIFRLDDYLDEITYWYANKPLLADWIGEAVLWMKDVFFEIVLIAMPTLFTALWLKNPEKKAERDSAEAPAKEQAAEADEQIVVDAVVPEQTI